jgi:hypothetical protein
MDKEFRQLDLYELLGVESSITHEELLYKLFSKNNSLSVFGRIKEGIIISSLVDKSFKELYDDYKKLSIIDREKIIDANIDKKSKKKYLLGNTSFINISIYLITSIILCYSFLVKNNFSYGIDLLFSVVLFTIISIIFSNINLIKRSRVVNTVIFILLNISLIILNITNVIFYIYFLISVTLFYLLIFKNNKTEKNVFNFQENYTQLSNNLKLYGLECNSSPEDKYISTLSFIIWKKVLGVETVSDSILCGPASIISISAILSRLSGEKVLGMPNITKDVKYVAKDEILIKDIIDDITNKYGASKVNNIIYEIIADLTYGGGGEDRLSIFSNKLLLTID